MAFLPLFRTTSDGMILILQRETIIRTMKPNFLLFFIIILVTAMTFAVVYVLFKDVVETNPGKFSIGLGAILLAGMFGMMNNIISNTTHDKLKEYE